MKKSWLIKPALLTLILTAPNFCFAEKKVAGRKLVPMSERELAELSDKYKELLEKSYPAKNWKTVGFCDWEKKLLMTLKVPRQMDWQEDCPNGGVVDGIKCCGPNESSPRLLGKFEVDGVERVLQIGMEAYETVTMEKRHGKKLSLRPVNLRTMGPTYGGASVFSKEINLGGLSAPLVKIDDVNRKVPDPEINTLIRFRHNEIGGMLYFVENKGKSLDQVPHQEHKLDSIVDSVIKSFKFRMKVTKLKWH